MPRNKEFQNDLSEGWKTLNKLWLLPLDEKMKSSTVILDEVFFKHKKPVVYWSGGKDSTVVLHQVLQYDKNIPVIFNDSLIEFPETYEFIEKLANDWNLNLHITKPDTNLWEIGKKYGWPILGKNISSNVERARRTGNFRKQLTKLEVDLAMNGLNISTKCSELLREKPAKKLEQELAVDVKIIGLRANESRARVRLWVDHGSHYYVKHYFNKKEGIWKASPITLWTENDIWEYNKKFNIPHAKLYDIGYPRNGCWACAMAIRNGQLERLYKNHNELYEKLILETPMGNELMKMQSFYKKEKIKQRYSRKEKIIKMETLFSDIK